ncbi:MAG: tetratricopeptide repeat protein [Myxococcales bacterium]|nr:tetratricopeptide repeat protein [Myxococcales bacterium]
MWSNYTARHAAQLIGLSESTVRMCIREGWLGHVGELPVRLSFRDLAALRSVKSLLGAGLSQQRLRRDLAAILAERSPGALAELALEARHGHVLVRGGENRHVSQLELALDNAPSSHAELHTFVTARAPGGGTVRLAVASRPSTAPQTAEDWIVAAVALEESDLAGAMAAYRKAIDLRPDATEAWINLGRLMAENGDPGGARACFDTALRLEPDDATALYNMGVVAQDLQDEQLAIANYVRALELDASLAEAHYNLATLYDSRGDARAAIRHINEYRKLTK